MINQPYLVYPQQKIVTKAKKAMAHLLVYMYNNSLKNTKCHEKW